MQPDPVDAPPTVSLLTAHSASNAGPQNAGPQNTAACRGLRFKRPFRRRTGFTLIELLFACGIVCILVSLLLPAIQQAREAARRTQCKARLTQISLAVLNYEDVHNVFPPGTVNESGPISTQENGLHTSWLVQILPMMDQPAAALLHQPNFSVYAEENKKLRAHFIKGYLCPSELPPDPHAAVAVTNYSGVTGGSDVAIDSDNDGVFYLNSSVATVHIMDGSSNQLAAAEHARVDQPSGKDLGWMSGTSATLRNGGVPINVYQNEEQYSQMFAKPLEATGGFSSVHTGGAQTALADGSIRFISENIDWIILRRLCSIDDGHDVDEF